PRDPADPGPGRARRADQLGAAPPRRRAAARPATARRPARRAGRRRLRRDRGPRAPRLAGPGARHVAGGRGARPGRRPGTARVPRGGRALAPDTGPYPPGHGPRHRTLGRVVDLGLTGKVALVAASSKGLGKASALALARGGARVTICARTEADLHTAAEEIRRETGAEVLAVPADLASAAGIQRVVAATAERFGGVDVLVNNSGGPARGRVAEFTHEGWRRGCGGGHGDLGPVGPRG